MNENYLIAIKAAIEAGKEILEVYNSDDFQVQIKADNSPLTLADKRANTKIMSYLDGTNLPVLSEEGKEIPFTERQKWKKFWLVDPLDGTKEFIKRNGEFTVNIALIEGHTPIFGVIYVPITKELFYGGLDFGAHKVLNIDSFDESREVLIDKSEKLPLILSRPFTVVASRSHLSTETQEYIEKLKELHSDLEFISKGSSLKLCAVAEGTADVYPRFAPTMEWDTAAGHAIVKAMGGTVSKTDGTPLVYNKENLLNPWFIVKSKLSHE